MATIRRNQTWIHKKPRSYKSRLLTEEENMFIHSLIRNDCTSLVTTVVELYLTRPPAHDRWIKNTSGVLCLVKHFGNQEHRFYLYSLDCGTTLWHCSVDKDSNYWAGMSFFHMFQGQSSVVGFNFANVQEADFLKTVIRNELQSTQIDSKFVIASKPNRSQTMKGGKKSLRAGGKLKISQPSNFVHVAHVNLSLNGSSFNTSTEDQYINEIFKLAGVTEAQIQDPACRKFMESVIKKSRKKYRAPAPPQLRFVPSNNNQPTSPTRRAPTRPSPRPQRAPSAMLSEGGNAPPPPPLPKLNLEHEISTSFSTPEPVIPNQRADFLESIRKGSTLRSVKQREIPRVDDEEFYKDDLAAALSKAIRIREKALQNDESFSESDEDYDTDEWDC